MMSITLILFIFLHFTSAALALDGQEDACSKSEVFFCENFEDRSLTDNRDMKGAKYKNSGWNLLSNDVSTNETEKVVNTQFFDGAKRFQVKYLPGRDGAGFLDTPRLHSLVF